jgi:hypothetical protein
MVKRLTALLVTLLVTLTIATTASAWGEIFPIKVKGWEYCDGQSPVKLTTKTAIPLWLRLDNGDVWTVSTSPGFPSGGIIPLFIDEMSSAKKSRTVAVLGGVLVEEGYLNFDGFLQQDSRTGGWKNFKGYFSQTQAIRPGCWSAGKIQSGKRIN